MHKRNVHKVWAVRTDISATRTSEETAVRPLAENDTSCLKATDLDKAEDYLDAEPYTQMWKVMKADRAEEKRQRGTQQVAMKSRLQIGPNPQMAARLQLQDKKKATAPG